MSLHTYAQLLAELHEQFERHEITYDEYIEACNALGETPLKGA